MATRIHVREGDRDWTADVSGTAVAVDGVAEPFQVREAADGRWHIAGGDDPRHELGIEGIGACAAADGDVVWVALGGELFEFHADLAARSARAHTRGREGLTAPMPATVVRVLASPGTRVSMGDALVVLEAMKMELPVRAPRDGMVTAVHCREGELVQSGVVLVEME